MTQEFPLSGTVSHPWAVNASGNPVSVQGTPGDLFPNILAWMDNISITTNGILPSTNTVVSEPPMHSVTNGATAVVNVSQVEGTGGTSPQDYSDIIVEFQFYAPQYINGDQLTNTAFLTYPNGKLTATKPVDIVEPLLDLTKTGAPLAPATEPVEAGDTIRYTVDVVHLAASTSAAFDLTIEDLLTDPDLSLVVGSVVVTGGAVGVDIVSGNVALDTTIVVTAEKLLLGDTMTITFDATVDVGVQPGSPPLKNISTIEYTSTPGDNWDERTRTDVDDETIDVIAPSAIKSIVDTSEPSTDAGEHNANYTDLAIGEIVRYRLQVELPEGSYYALQLFDPLPAGLELLAPDEIFVSFTSDDPMTVAGDLESACNGDVPPTVPLPSGRYSQLGNTDVFSIGNVVNNDDDDDDEFLTLEFNALVMNSSGNDDELELDNQFIVRSNIDNQPRQPRQIS